MIVPDISSAKVLVPGLLAAFLLHVPGVSTELIIPVYGILLMFTFLVLGNQFNRVEIITNTLLISSIYLKRPNSTNAILIYSILHSLSIALLRVFFPISFS
jgi:hypothetical protein